MRADRYVGFGANFFTAVAAVPHGYAVPPPQLTRNAPVLDVFHPIIIGFCKALGHEGNLLVHNRVDCGTGKSLHFYKPLLGNKRLYRGVATVTVSYTVRVRLNFYKMPACFKLFHKLFSAFVAVKPLEFARKRVHCSVIVHNPHNGQIMAQTDLEIVGVVRGRDFYNARTEFHIGVRVADNGYRLVYYGQNYVFAYKVLIALVLGVYCNRGVAEHGFGAGCGNHKRLVGIFHKIFNMPEEARLLRIVNLDVGKRSFTVGAPVYNSAAAVDKLFVVKVNKNLAHGF